MHALDQPSRARRRRGRKYGLLLTQVATVNARRTVDVHLPSEAVHVWRPVQSDHLGRDEFRLIGPVPEDEVWGFQPGEVFRCRDQVFADGTVDLAAFARVS